LNFNYIPLKPFYFKSDEFVSSFKVGNVFYVASHDLIKILSFSNGFYARSSNSGLKCKLLHLRFLRTSRSFFFCSSKLLVTSYSQLSANQLPLPLYLIVFLII